MSSSEISLAEELRETREIFLNKLQQGIDEIKRENETFRASLATMDNRIEVIEDKIVNHDYTLEALVQDKLKIQSELDMLREKYIDASNRQRRRNIKIKFLPEVQETRNLISFLITWWSKLGYRIQEDDLERAHRVTPKAPSKRPRDTVVAFSREHKRDEFLKFYKSLGPVTYKSAKVLIFADVTPETLQKRALLKPIAAMITKNNFKFMWGFPASIIVYYKGEKLTASNVDEGQWLLNKLGISSEKSSATHPTPSTPTLKKTPSSLDSPSYVAHSSEEDSCNTEMESSQYDTPAPSERKRKDPCETPPDVRHGNKRRNKKTHKKKA